MKIAILGSRGFPSTYGGYETLVRQVAPEWQARGHDVTVYCRSRIYGHTHWTTDGVKCFWTPGLESKSFSTLTFGASAHLDAALRGFDAALVLNIANGFYLPLLRARGIRAVVNTDGIEWERGKWSPLARRVFYAGAWMAAKYADVIVADSHAISRIWEDLFGVQSEYIPYGATVRYEQRHDRVDELRLPLRRYVLVVARLTPENNIEKVLDALDAMIERPVAVVVGASNYRSELEERLKLLDERRTIRWLGHVSDQELLTQLWSNSGVYVHGHSVGGTNPALLQALGAGAPTLALDTPYNREVIEHDEQLFGSDPRDLANRITKTLASDAVQKRLVDRGQRIVDERYGWESVCDKYLDALQRAS